MGDFSGDGWTTAVHPHKKESEGILFCLDHRTSQGKIISVDVDYEALTRGCGRGFPAMEQRTGVAGPNAQVLGNEEVT
jgi:hypothetical protein